MATNEKPERERERKTDRYMLGQKINPHDQGFAPGSILGDGFSNGGNFHLSSFKTPPLLKEFMASSLAVPKDKTGVLSCPGAEKELTKV